MLPADCHVHSEWSWDATNGSLADTCARAVSLRLPALAFTEHADFGGGWRVLAEDLAEYPHLAQFVDGETLRPPPLDVDGYAAAVEGCRRRVPGVRILLGVELGDPHRDPEAAARLLAAAPFERVLASLHSLPDGGGFSEMPNLFRTRKPAVVIRDYLAELVRLLEGFDAFDALGHIDYAARYWPAEAGAFDAREFEQDFRAALRALAATQRALELNTNRALPPEVLAWWREEGGASITFGSDAHEPARLASGFAEAARTAVAAGFAPGLQPHDPWQAQAKRSP